jgi:mono/diheme cytochrome c family protein
MKTGLRLSVCAGAVAAAMAVGWTVHGAPAGQADVKVRRVPARATVSVEGKDSFAAYCAPCHGREARGDGPAAPALKMPVPDLTLIASRHGKFEPLEVEFLITGKDKLVPAHGGAVEMPIWGPVFHSMEPDAAKGKLRMQNLVHYLETIQRAAK